MKILLLIDNLNSGGSQRQLVNLAIGLKSNHFDVTVLTYAQGDHFQGELDQHGIMHISVYNRSTIKTMVNVFRTIISQKPDVICAYLFRPSLLALTSKLFYWHPSIFVSERSFEFPWSDWSRPLSRALYPLARKVIVNSASQMEFLKKKISWITPKLVFISNSVDLEKFHPDKNTNTHNSIFTIVSVGHVNELKNTKTLIRAVAIIQQQYQIPVCVRWVGRNYDIHGSINSYYNECVELLQELGVASHWHWEGKKQNVQALYASADVMVHPSFGEGFPNTIGEALASGCPVIASNVSDHPIIIQEGVNGYLFDPANANGLASKIYEYYTLSFEKKDTMRKMGRAIAEKEFALSKMINSYILVFKSAMHQ